MIKHLSPSQNFVLVNKRAIIEASHCGKVDMENGIGDPGFCQWCIHHDCKFCTLRPIQGVLLHSLKVLVRFMDLGQRNRFMIVKPCLNITVEDLIGATHRPLDQHFANFLLECLLDISRWKLQCFWLLVDIW